MLTAVVLAGSRGDTVDSMALDAGVSHKALLDIHGRPMLARVLEALKGVSAIDRIVVCAHDPALLLAACSAGEDVLARPQAESPSRSVAALLEEFGAPLLVTTGDHPLLTPVMVVHLLAQAPHTADVVAGVATRETVLGAYPGTRRTWLRFRDGDISGCNLFLLRTAGAASVLRFWRKVEQARKRPTTIARLIGPVSLLLYATRTARLRIMLRLLGRRAGARLAIVALPFADAAIDVDKPDDLVLVRSILDERAGRDG